MQTPDTPPAAVCAHVCHVCKGETACCTRYRSGWAIFFPLEKRDRTDDGHYSRRQVEHSLPRSAESVGGGVSLLTLWQAESRGAYDTA